MISFISWQKIQQKFQKRLASKALILLYHRIAQVELDPWNLCVTPDHFAEQLEVLQKYANPISLKQLVSFHRAGNIPERTVVVTFDDGYADNLHYAKPILEKYQIPATIFVITGDLGKAQEFWWDKLEQLLLQPGQLPEKLSLEIRGRVYHWELGQAANYTQQAYQSDRTSKADSAKPGSRMSFYYSIWEALLPLSARERQNLIAEILKWSNIKLRIRQHYYPLLPEDLSRLEQGGLIEIGAHTVNHLLLRSQSILLQQAEIQQSKAYLEEILNRRVVSFSYPFGGRTAETIEIVKAAGFDCACSTVEDIVWRKSNCFDLPRFTVENWNGEEFTKQLSKWLN
ncbi:MAG: polysaccharide deacetylase family protein [Snowella sp.]